MNQKTNYLITGSSGFLGKILTKYLIDKGNNVVCLGRGSQSDLIHDITQPFNLESDEKFDIIVHSAGKAHTVPKNEAENQAFYQVNFEGTKNLCEALSSSLNLPKAFIFISTVAVYGVEHGISISESHSLSGNSPYAKSKILAEEWLQNWANKHNVILSILRLPLVAGRNPPGNLGSMIKGIKRGYYFNISGNDARKSMVLADDVAKIIPKVEAIGGIYNLTDGYHPSLKELSLLISNELNKKIPLTLPHFIIKNIARVGDLFGKNFPINSDKLNKIKLELTFDDTRARRKLGWAPTEVLKGLEL